MGFFGMVKGAAKGVGHFAAHQTVHAAKSAGHFVAQETYHASKGAVKGAAKLVAHGAVAGIKAAARHKHGAAHHHEDKYIAEVQIIQAPAVEPAYRPNNDPHPAPVLIYNNVVRVNVEPEEKEDAVGPDDDEEVEEHQFAENQPDPEEKEALPLAQRILYPPVARKEVPQSASVRSELSGPGPHFFAHVIPPAIAPEVIQEEPKSKCCRLMKYLFG